MDANQAIINALHAINARLDGLAADIAFIKSNLVEGAVMASSAPASPTPGPATDRRQVPDHVHHYNPLMTWENDLTNAEHLPLALVTMHFHGNSESW
jgi:hypothetical protein